MKLGQLRCMRDEISEIVGRQKTAAPSQQNINYTASMETQASQKSPDPLGYAAGIEDARSRASYPVTQSTSKGRYIKPPKGKMPTVIDFKPYNSNRKLPISEPYQHGAAHGLVAKAPMKIKKAWATLAKTAFATQPISTKPLDVSLKPTPMKPQGNAVVSAKTPSKNAGAPKGPQAKRVSGVKLTPLTKMGERWGRGLASSLLQKKPGRHFNED